MLKLQYFGHLMWTDDSLEKPLMLGNTEGRRRSGYQRMRWLDDITNAVNMNLGKLREMVRNREAWHAACSCKESDTTGWLNNKNNAKLNHSAVHLKRTQCCKSAILQLNGKKIVQSLKVDCLLSNPSPITLWKLPNLFKSQLLHLKMELIINKNQWN